MAKFKIGQTVTCIDVRGLVSTKYKEKLPVVGGWYVVRAVVTKSGCIRLLSIVNSQQVYADGRQECSFSPSRFALVKLGMPFFTVQGPRLLPTGASFPSLTNLIARYRADQGVTGTTTVTQVLDQSGNNNTLVNNGGAVALSATAFNSHPAFSFTAANAGTLVCAGFSSPALTGSVISVFAYATIGSAGGTSAGLVSYSISGQDDFSGSSGFALNLPSGSAIELISAGGLQDQSIGGAGINDHIRFGGITDNTNHAIGAWVNGTGTYGFPSGGFNNGSWTNGGTLVVGGRATNAGVTTPFWGGLVAEVVVCNAILSTTEISNLDAYFLAQWGS